MDTEILVSLTEGVDSIVKGIDSLGSDFQSWWDRLGQIWRAILLVSGLVSSLYIRFRLRRHFQMAQRTHTIRAEETTIHLADDGIMQMEIEEYDSGNVDAVLPNPYQQKALELARQRLVAAGKKLKQHDEYIAQLEETVSGNGRRAERAQVLLTKALAERRALWFDAQFATLEHTKPGRFFKRKKKIAREKQQQKGLRLWAASTIAKAHRIGAIMAGAARQDKHPTTTRVNKYYFLRGDTWEASDDLHQTWRLVGIGEWWLDAIDEDPEFLSKVRPFTPHASDRLEDHIAAVYDLFRGPQDEVTERFKSRVDVKSVSVPSQFVPGRCSMAPPFPGA